MHEPWLACMVLVWDCFQYTFYISGCLYEFNDILKRFSFEEMRVVFADSFTGPLIPSETLLESTMAFFFATVHMLIKASSFGGELGIVFYSRPFPGSRCTAGHWQLATDTSLLLVRQRLIGCRCGLLTSCRSSFSCILTNDQAEH